MKTTNNGALIITEAEAVEAANTFDLIRQVITKKSIEDFYGSVEPTYPVDLQAVYNRLRGWRKQAFRQFIMSGWVSLQTFQTDEGKAAYPKQWGYGKYSAADRINAVEQEYCKGAIDWNDCTERKRTLSWRQLCELYLQKEDQAV